MGFDIVSGLGVGVFAGLTAGALGVSPGGGLVVGAILLLGAEQHVAQGISLTAQLAPTSLSGIRRYRQSGSEIRKDWVFLLGLGMILGGTLGSVAAARVSASSLQWTYVGYLLVLDALLILRGNRPSSRDAGQATNASWLAVFTVGVAAGVSSGFLGIGGGLAISVGLVAWLRAGQHQAQMMSLVLALVPTSVRSALVYWQQGWIAAWPVLLAVIAGLWAGTDIGARIATRLDQRTLRWAVVAIVSGMAVYMAYKAQAG